MSHILRTCQTEAIGCAKERIERDELETNLSLCTGAGKTIVIYQCSRQMPGINRTVLVFPSLLLLKQYAKDMRKSYTDIPVYYMATDGTLPGTPRLSEGLAELSATSWCVWTTYVSAIVLFPKIVGKMPDLLIHDEAHHMVAPQYASALAAISSVRRINLSATLPESKLPHYKYPLLKGIRGGVVRDFNLDLFLCVDRERTASSATALLELIIRKLLTHHPRVKLLIYTREANTVGEGASSVQTFLTAHAVALEANGWLVRGIKEDTGDRDAILREFEGSTAPVSILVSCRTLSEGIDLKGANCMLPWDPTASIVDNIQRIGRVLRLYKDGHGKVLKEQPPSTVVIPVFLPKAEYVACSGDRSAIHALLESQIAEGERGNFQPIVNVCTALKSELAEEDSELFNALLNYPRTPKVTVDRGLIECVAKARKKSADAVTEEVATALVDKEECVDAVREGVWDNEQAGEIVGALAESQGITLVVRDGAEVEMFGKGGDVVTVEKTAEGGYKAIRGGTKKAAADLDAARNRVAHRMRINFSDACQIMLGLETVEGADTLGGMVLSRLTAEVKVDENWEARRLEWVAMFEKLGRAPSQSSEDKDEKKLAVWQTNQRMNYRKKNKNMTIERFRRLDNPTITPGWKWEEEDSWEPNRQNWIKYAVLGYLTKQNMSDSDIKRAIVWQSAQRALYKKKSLLSERYLILNNNDLTPGWSWGFDERWEEQRQHWMTVFKRLGRFPKQGSKDKEEARAGLWQTNQRMYYNKKDSRLTLERISILEHETSGWQWEERDSSWETNRQEWIKVYSRIGKPPNHTSTNLDEAAAGQWQSNQRQAYNKKLPHLTPERIRILEKETPGWEWTIDKWEESRQHWIEQFTLLGHFPSNKSKNPSEKKAGAFQQNQRQAFKKKAACMTPERIAILNATPGWSWSADEAPITPVETSSDVVTPSHGELSLTESVDVITHVSSGTRSRHVTTPSSEETESATRSRYRSALEEFHKRFKTMNAATYHTTITANPAEFTAYHDIADQYDARDPPDRHPLTKIATLLSRFNKPSYSAIDLGCGRNRLRSLPAVSRVTWTSVDVAAVDTTVTVADMSALPYDEETYDIAVLGRSLWARNHMDVLHEVNRILKVGGRIVICESFKRWLSEENQNTLLQCVLDAGFDIQYEDGTSITDNTADVFQYIIAVKK